MGWVRQSGGQPNRKHPWVIYNRIVALPKLGQCLLTAALLISASACASSPADDRRPMVAIVTPPDGAHYAAGRSIPFTIAAAGSRGIVRIELLMDDRIVATQANPQQSPTFSTRIEHTPQRQGRLLFSAVAVDSAGVASEPFPVSLVVGDPPALSALPPIVATPVIGPGGCVLAAAFLEDLTIPDGTVIAGGTTFTKTWRMRNTSGCDWGEGYTIAFFSDTPMHPTGSEPISPTPSNAVAEISVPLVAPTQAGVYTTTWRLKTPTGQFFGNRVFAVIRVP